MKTRLATQSGLRYTWSMEIKWTRVASGDYEAETEIGPARIFRMNPSAWNAEIDRGDGPGRFESSWVMVADGAATLRYAKEMVEHYVKGAR